MDIIKSPPVMETEELLEIAFESHIQPVQAYDVVIGAFTSGCFKFSRHSEVAEYIRQVESAYTSQAA